VSGYGFDIQSSDVDFIGCRVSTDQTAYVQGFIDRGELIPAGIYDCPGGLEVPADYVDRAKAAGRTSPDGRWPLGAALDGPHGVRCNWGDGGWMLLGAVEQRDGGGDGGMVLGRNGYAIYIPGTQAIIPADFHIHLNYAAQEATRALIEDLQPKPPLS
jgi:hypothetical protein